MSTIPLSVMLAGPAAVAEYLEARTRAEEAAKDARAERMWNEVNSMNLKVLRAVGLGPDQIMTSTTHKAIVAVGATLQAACMLVLSLEGDQRGKARDRIEELLDETFDRLEYMVENTPDGTPK